MRVSVKVRVELGTAHGVPGGTCRVRDADVVWVKERVMVEGEVLPNKG